jgi:hypothetical protein
LAAEVDGDKANRAEDTGQDQVHIAFQGFVDVPKRVSCNALRNHMCKTKKENQKKANERAKDLHDEEEGARDCDDAEVENVHADELEGDESLL